MDPSYTNRLMYCVDIRCGCSWVVVVVVGEHHDITNV